MDGGMGRGVGGDGRQAFLGGVGLYRYLMHQTSTHLFEDISDKT